MKYFKNDILKVICKCECSQKIEDRLCDILSETVKFSDIIAEYTKYKMKYPGSSLEISSKNWENLKNFVKFERGNFFDLSFEEISLDEFSKLKMLDQGFVELTKDNILDILDERLVP